MAKRNSGTGPTNAEDILKFLERIKDKSAEPAIIRDSITEQNKRIGTTRESENIESFDGYIFKKLSEYNSKIDDLERSSQEVQGKLEKAHERIKELEVGTKATLSKNIEILGLFSAVLALIIVDVNIVKSANNFLTAILLICGLTLSLSLFASLIHHFWTYPPKRNMSLSFYLPIAGLIILLLLGIVTHDLENYAFRFEFGKVEENIANK